ncbi:hypothetical protein PsorP6_018864 [Peronosclerospora sorghi]|nr:hypothetical protein PsorP6_018864 [Peronosclerospora sorghi]
MAVDSEAAGTAFYPLHEEDDDDVSMRSPLSTNDHEMHDGDEEHSEEDYSDRCSVSDNSTDGGEAEEGDEDDDEDEDEDETKTMPMTKMRTMTRTSR